MDFTSNENSGAEMDKKSGFWKRLLVKRRSLVLLTPETNQFFDQVGNKEPLEILLLNERYSYISKLLENAIKAPSSDSKSSQLILIREFLHQARSIPLRTVIVFCAVKCLGPPASLSRMSGKIRASVENQHLVLGKATEFLYWSQLFHYSMSSTESKEAKIKVLIGDFLITQFYSCLAALQSSEVTRLMSEALVTFAEDFYSKLPCSKYGCFDECALAVLFANAFKSAAILSGHDEGGQKVAMELGKSFGKIYGMYTAIQREPRRDLNEVEKLKKEFASEIRAVNSTNSAASETFQTLLSIMDKAVGENLTMGYNGIVLPEEHEEV